MIRRAFWLTTGLALGAGGTLWARRQAALIAARLESREVGSDLVVAARRGTRAGASRVRLAVEAGRASARHREEQLWHDLGVRAGSC